jgi:hypothetical protein
MTMSHPADLALSGPAGRRLPFGGPMVQPFPEPGHAICTTMEQLQLAAATPPTSEAELLALAQLPRPWDPATCSGPVRAELWVWLDLVAAWVNEQQLWNVTRPGIPECWPAHPHLVHDLAVLACGRYYASFAVTPAALEDWHRYTLPSFLEQLRDRLGDGCQPQRHQPRPRGERDESYCAPRARQFREQVFGADQQTQTTDGLGG